MVKKLNLVLTNVLCELAILSGSYDPSLLCKADAPLNPAMIPSPVTN